METIQIVLGRTLLIATDKVARRTKANRSAVVREALREHLRRLDLQAKEDRDRDGYSKKRAVVGDSQLWEAEAAWPVK